MGITALLQRDSRKPTEHVIEAKDKFGELVHSMQREHTVKI